MSATVSTAQVRELLDAGAQALEVLPPSAYAREHLPGAVNIPLWQVDERTVTALDSNRPVVVYCYDTECDLSPRAAALLDVLGFVEVYDYTGSKVEWLAQGLPVEGELHPEDRAGALADPAVPTCGPDDICSDILNGDDTGLVVVVGRGDVVLGTLRREACSLAVPARVAMEPGPATVRPSIDRWELAKSMDDDGQDHVLVTTLDGRLIGLLTREALHGI